ncbi:hypothetical protein J5868_02225 [Candidatus Saccharibacteria bacterium]|nr:hypothetical protein [Candidatus Saccharibacteria bacterium]
MCTNHNKIITGSLVTITSLSFAALTLPSVLADDGFIDVVTIDVPVSCSLSSSGMTSHNKTIQNGNTENEIGTTNIKVTCNDNTGYALYAIGYTNDEYGNNKLTSSTLGSTHDIITSTTITTGTSSWAMKLTKTGSTYLPIIAGSTDDTNRQTGDPDFSGYTEVPNEYTKVAYFPTSTDTGIGASGSNLTTTYRAYISQTQPAGTYIGQVKYTLVHPNTAPTPAVPIPPSPTCNTPVTGATYMQDITSSNKATILAGMTTGNRYYLRDSRDGKPYCVGKLADGNLWMLDNLALDIVETDINTLKGNTNASDTTLEYLKGTHVRGDGNITTGDTNYPTATVGYADSNDYYSIPKIAISGDCGNAYCVNDPESGKWTSDSTTQATINGTTSVAQGKIGIYYNYCAASAGSYCYGSGTDYTGSPSSDPNTSSLRDVTEDICPSGWRLPTSDTNYTPYGEFKTLYGLYRGCTPSQEAAFQTALSTPLSGSFISGKAYNQGISGGFWSSTWNNTNSMRNLSVGSSYAYPSYGGSSNYGFSVRCILGS